MKNSIPQTAEIFRILSKGQFISANSSDKSIAGLFNVLDEPRNFEDLYDYFLQIGFVLEHGDEYFYFSRKENKVDLENKIQAAYRWIDILDFLKSYNNSFSAGYRFTPSDILVRIPTDTELESKLESLRRHTDKDTHQEILEKTLKKLVDDSFIEMENEITHQYKVLNSFKYLEQLISVINIPEEVRNEIPE